MTREVLPARTSLVAPLLGVLFAVVAVVSERRCDRSLDVDQWGRPFQRYYRNQDNVVQSLGLDGVPFTSDDVWSH